MDVQKGLGRIKEKINMASQTIEILSTSFIPEHVRNTAFLRSFAIMKIPLLAFLNPSVVNETDDVFEISIPLTYRSKNHLGSMYFGALASGADLAVGFLAMKEIRRSKKKIALVFKSFHADFIKRVEGDAVFLCTEGPKIKALVQKAIESTDRVSDFFEVTCRCPSKLGDEVVAKFRLELSLRNRH